MIQMTGGLGNQMFQYALYTKLKSMGKEVVMDDFTKYDGSETHSLSLTTAFPISYQKGSRKDYIRLMDASMNPFVRFRRHFFGRKWKLYQEEDATVFSETPFTLDDAYLIGYFQSEKYFQDVKASLKKDFSLKRELLSKEALEFEEKIKGSESVAVHIRRGDYVSEKFSPLYGGICTDAYYEAAIRYFRETLNAPIFYYFSNDPKWVRENMDLSDGVVVDCATSDTGYIDLHLMKNCKHIIMANSSFSWWGAWLNENPKRQVIAPAKWLNTSDAKDIYADCMGVRIDANGEMKHV